jgi:hypothetical protein
MSFYVSSEKVFKIWLSGTAFSFLKEENFFMAFLFGFTDCYLEKLNET